MNDKKDKGFKKTIKDYMEIQTIQENLIKSKPSGITLKEMIGKKKWEAIEKKVLNNEVKTESEQIKKV